MHFIEDGATLESDYPFLDGLRVSSLPRALLENLEPDRSQNGIVKCLGASGVKEILEREFLTGGEKAVNEIRDSARAISVATHKTREFGKLDNIIGALRKLTRSGDPAVFIAAMKRLQEFSARLEAEDFDRLRSTLEQSNAFCDDDSRILRF